ncbi:MAG: hypothetical protein IRZ31_19915 [Thermogemmatispora sp.]|uniref:hypothetical protein n=1 Tax=Thermogemmatispora sp. TaxID=1968838 RepID=UPI00262FA1F3|nr:hypothetical protein [Thermogemmatispora sp.]MBX5459165.1 hypothetical protein [Thermogemmatispora sp.]
MEQRIADLERRVSELEFVYRNLAKDTTVLYGILRMDLDALKERTERIEQRLDTLNGEVAQVSGRLDRMDQRLDRMDQRFDRLEQQVGQILTLLQKPQGR